jgi:hypothetical protein
MKCLTNGIYRLKNLESISFWEQENYISIASCTTYEGYMQK